MANGANDLEVRIVELRPMRVASVRAVGRSPERDAWSKLALWAARQGLVADPDAHPVFGFNNPSPPPGGGEYGYEFWIAIGPDVRPDEGIEIKEFPGGRYAATTCRLFDDPHGTIGEVWMKLWEWVESSAEYSWRRAHELERPLNPGAPEAEIRLQLLLPID